MQTKMHVRIDARVAISCEDGLIHKVLFLHRLHVMLRKCSAFLYEKFLKHIIPLNRALVKRGM